MIDRIFERLGHSPASCARMVQDVVEASGSHLPIRRLKEEVRNSGLELPGDAFERALLKFAAQETAPRIAQLPVHEPVKALLRNEFQFYIGPTHSPENSLEIGNYLFVVACKTISLRRFPSGPMDWEVSGFPRSWLAHIKKRDLPRVLMFLYRKLGGFAPMFFMHVARRPRNRSLIIERQVLGSYYRMARSLELQPAIKGILAHAWFHDPEALRLYPHLYSLNRPYLEAGGLITTAGPTPADSGFGEHNLERQKLLEKGEIRLRMGVAMWPRQAAIEWAGLHPELDQ